LWPYSPSVDYGSSPRKKQCNPTRATLLEVLR
jgi:hypothetical protein